ncbi:MAG: VanZ family protein [Rhizomicrobium sp.]|jgi:VanZ family protein
MKWSHLLALYLFWPAVLLVVWGELTPNPPDLEVVIWDKILHFIAYFGLAGLATVALEARRPAVWAVLVLAVLGGMLEILQGFTGRDPSFYDEIANILGAAMGGCSGWLLMTLLQAKPLIPERE